MTGYSYYDGSGTQMKSHFVSGMTLSTQGDVRGAYQVGTLGAGFVDGYMTTVPAGWQAALGGPVKVEDVLSGKIDAYQGEINRHYGL